MGGFLKRFLLNSNDHLSEEELAQWICRELSFAEKLIAHRHLAHCWLCRLRKDDFEGARADQAMSLYRMHTASQVEELDDRYRRHFIERLEERLQGARPRSGWRIRVRHSLPGKSWSMTRPQSAAMMLAFGGAVAVGHWWLQRSPQITSNSLLVRAQVWDGPYLPAKQGVVYQSVRISSADQTMRRSIYRDIQGKRREREVKLAAGEDRIRRNLLRAGVDWDEPMSATAYQTWHDHQRVRSDTIVRAGRHLLKLTTTVPEGSISEQTLTVRDTDFHPVGRTVALRNSENIEIAELDFKILPWSAVDASVFEPAAPTLPMASPELVPVQRLFAAEVPAMLTDSQMDEAELGARLVLNQLHADTGEQIEIARHSDAVEVRGLVETAERKHELQAQLMVVPHLKVSLQSLSEVADQPARGEPATERVDSEKDEPSPLERYLRPKTDDLEVMNSLSRRLFERVLIVSQESKAVEDLQERFDPEKQKTLMASATSLQLIYSHRERLLAAIDQEREVLLEIQGKGRAGSMAVPSETSLAALAGKNLSLYQELTQNNNVSTRSAPEIVADMSAAIADLTVRIRQTNTGLGDGPAGKGKD